MKASIILTVALMLSLFLGDSCRKRISSDAEPDDSTQTQVRLLSETRYIGMNNCTYGGGSGFDWKDTIILRKFSDSTLEINTVDYQSHYSGHRLIWKINGRPSQVPDGEVHVVEEIYPDSLHVYGIQHLGGVSLNSLYFDFNGKKQ